MEILFNEHNPEAGIIGLKRSAFINAINENENEDLWIARLRTTKGMFVGYFCMFSNDDYEYHLQNDKGAVRVFKTIESAVIFYEGLGVNGRSITNLRLAMM